jgi:hypothetical protein
MDGFTIFGAVPWVRLWNSPEPICVTQTSIGPSRSDRNARNDRPGRPQLLATRPCPEPSLSLSRFCPRWPACSYDRRLLRDVGQARPMIRAVWSACTVASPRRVGLPVNSHGETHRSRPLGWLIVEWDEVRKRSRHSSPPPRIQVNAVSAVAPAAEGGNDHPKRVDVGKKPRR